MQLTRAKVKLIHEAADAALRTVAESFGLAYSPGAASFTKNNVTVKGEMSVIGNDGLAVDRDAETFTRRAFLYGFKADDLGREFTNAGERYRIVGLRTRSRKYPVMVERKDGKRFKYAAETALALLNGSKGGGRK